MKKSFILLLTALLTAITGANAWTVPDEELHYSVRFKWGLIDAYVGIAKVSTCNSPGTGTFTATLSGKSIDLFGHYYEAQDTIVGSIMSDAVQLNSTQNISHEHGIFDIETIQGNTVHSHVSHYGSGLTIDLLSVFYYMRQIDYEKYRAGQHFHIDITESDQVEALDISYLGKETLETSGETFHITLTFTSRQSGKSDSMEVWIATGADRTPILIKGSLSVGHMECRYLSAETLGSMPSYK